MTEASVPAAPSGAIARRTFRLLARQGFQPRHERRGERFPHLWFKVNGEPFLLQLDELDADFCQVCTGHVLSPDRTEQELLRVAHDTQATAKVAKIYLGGDRSGRGRRFVEFQVPILLGGRRLTPALLGRAMHLLRVVGADFRDRLLLERPVAEA